MKFYAVTGTTLLLLFSGAVFAEHTHMPETNETGEKVIIPSSMAQTPADLNHMGVGSDKSDVLGVPYFNGQRL